MGVYIKDMEMPKGDEGLVLVIFKDGTVYSPGLLTKSLIRNKNVKAIPVPTPHGRLIDVDRLIKVMIATLEALRKNPKMDNQEAHLLAAFHTVGDMVNNAPTVIEAEDE